MAADAMFDRPSLTLLSAPTVSLLQILAPAIVLTGPILAARSWRPDPGGPILAA